jgi:hypothetical protein
MAKPNTPPNRSVKEDETRRKRLLLGAWVASGEGEDVFQRGVALAGLDARVDSAVVSG